MTVTNTSSVPLTWHLSGDLSAITATPLGSTIPVGGAVDVSVTAKVKNASLVVSFDADVAPSQSLPISINLFGDFISLPPDIDFGNVPVGVEAAVKVSAFVGGPPGLVLSSSNPAFALSGFAPLNGYWTLTFRSFSTGPQETTLTYSSFINTVCPPNTIIARATAVAP